MFNASAVTILTPADVHPARSRWMDPTIGRFTSFDSFEGNVDDPATLHKYLYANANPLAYSDPSGHMSLGELGMVVSVAALITTITGIPTIGAARGLVQGPRTISGTGGQDITPYLIPLREKVLRAYSGKSNQAKAILRDELGFLSPYDAATGWDTYQLFTKKKDYFSTGGSSPFTVTVNGQVHDSAEVNYWLYGTMLRAVDDAYGSSSLAIGLTKVRAYRATLYLGSGTEGRVQWTNAGYYGDLALAREVALKGGSPSTSPFVGTLTARWGNDLNNRIVEKQVGRP